jgi:hypothetical protein
MSPLNAAVHGVEVTAEEAEEAERIGAEFLAANQEAAE